MSEALAIYEERVSPEIIALEWWVGLSVRKGDCAELRRARCLAEVVLTPAYQQLWQRLHGRGWNSVEGVALVAGVLSHGRSHDPSATFAAQLARQGHGDRPRFSGLRFRRLLQYGDREQLFEPMIRALSLIGCRANLTDLAKGLYGWNDKTRRQWAFDYYGSNPKAE